MTPVTLNLKKNLKKKKKEKKKRFSEQKRQKLGGFLAEDATRKTKIIALLICASLPRFGF